MVLASRTVQSVPNIELNGEKIANFKPAAVLKRDQLLETCTQNTYVGILSQLSVLANYAGEIFGGLLRESNQTFDRIVVLSNKVEEITAFVPAVDKFFTDHQPESILQNKRAEFTLPIVQDAAIFTPDSLPQSLANTYKTCYKPPALDKMDPYMEDGRKCIELYTNPNFFLYEWIEEQKKQRVAAREQRIKRREERRAQREKEGPKQNLAPKQIAVLEKVFYDPNTGEKIVKKTGERTQASFIQQSSLNLSKSQSGGSPIALIPSPPSGSGPSLAVPTEEFNAYAPPADDMPPPLPDREQAAPPPPQFYTPQPQYQAPVVQEPIYRREPQQQQTQRQPPPPATPQYQEVRAPQPVYQPSPPPPPKMDEARAPPPPPSFNPPPAAPAFSPPSAPPPPPPEFSAGGGGSGGLAAAISKGVQLKKSEAAPAKKPDARTGLLEGIRGGIRLKQVDNKAQQQQAKTEAAPSSVAAILARRIAIAASDDEDSEEEDDADWDD
eukprot:TRINITY_DN1074_c0_g1_i3.p1 TRINITY_DN1074_c0_g1~~TRINITY_DN1074_c0_g1_i3.p1  ORF type:complete len:496 (+),score=151.95 TRINITY_DN1074_c0_g1_i3:64-1551(+)